MSQCSSTEIETDAETWGRYRILAQEGQVVDPEMSADEWIALPPHPRQRNTKRHAAAEHWRLARRAKGAVKEALCHTVAGELDGRLCKVDGHTRAYLWQTGGLPKPTTVRVKVFRVRDRDELNALYSTFDAPTAAEKEHQKVFGAFRESGLELKSPRLKHGYLVSALNIALRGRARAHQDKKATQALDLYKAVDVMRGELELLDSINPRSEVFYSGVIAAALIGLSLHPDGIEFFHRLNDREGSKKGGTLDPVESVLVYVDGLRQQRQSWFQEQQEDLAARTYRGFLAWIGGDQEGNQYWFRTKLRRVDLAPCITEMKEKKGILGDPAL